MHGLLRAVELQLVEALARGAETIDAGAFRAFLWHQPDPFYRNTALPVQRPEEWPSEIARVADVFHRAGRIPRVEHVAELWPGLASGLEASGFNLDQVLTVMIAYSPGASIPSSDVWLLDRGASELTIESYLAAQDRAFGGDGTVDRREVESLALALNRGWTAIATKLEDGTPVAGAALIGMGNAAELAGVWTAPELRGQGVAKRLCRTLIAEFFARGGRMIWLGASDDDSRRLYARLGFWPMATQLVHRLEPR